MIEVVASSRSGTSFTVSNDFIFRVERRERVGERLEEVNRLPFFIAYVKLLFLMENKVLPFYLKDLKDQPKFYNNSNSLIITNIIISMIMK